jgi:hypothetical protein
MTIWLIKSIMEKVLLIKILKKRKRVLDLIKKKLID